MFLKFMPQIWQLSSKDKKKKGEGQHYWIPKHVFQESNQLLIVSTIHLLLMLLFLLHDLLISSIHLIFMLVIPLIQVLMVVSITLPDILIVIDLIGNNFYTANDIGIMLYL